MDTKESFAKVFSTSQKVIEDWAERYNLQGYCFYKLGKLREAEESFKKALDINSSNSRYLNNLAEVYLEGGQIEKAAEIFARLLKLVPDNKNFKIKLARTYAMLKRFDDAFELEPDNKNILILIWRQIFKWGGACKRCGACCRGVVLIREGKVIATEEDFQKACAEDPLYHRWVPLRNEKGNLMFSCKLVSPEGLCTDYQHRQKFCQDYPNYLTPSLHEGCGYRRETDLNFPALSNIALANAIAQQAINLGLFEVALEVLEKKVQEKVAV